MQGRAGAYAGSRRGAIHLAVGKNADIAAVTSGRESGPDEDGAVKETQVFFEGMLDREVVHDGPFDAAAGVDEPVDLLGYQLQARLLRLNEGIKGATIGNVELHTAEAGYINFLI